MPAAHLTCPAGKPFVVIHLNLDISYYGRRMLGGTVLGDTVRSSRVCDCRRFSRARDCRLACSASKTSCPTARPARIGHQSIGNTICAPKYKAMQTHGPQPTAHLSCGSLNTNVGNAPTLRALFFSYPRSTLDTETRCRSIARRLGFALCSVGPDYPKAQMPGAPPPLPLSASEERIKALVEANDCQRNVLSCVCTPV